MTRTIGRSRLKRNVKSGVGTSVLIKRDNKSLVGMLGYEGDVGTGDGFFVPVGTGKFFVISDVYSNKEKG